MTKEFTIPSHADLLLPLCRLLGAGPVCTNPEQAKRYGAVLTLLEDLCEDGEDIWEIQALDYALTAVFWHAARRAGTEFLDVDAAPLIEAVGSEALARVVLHRQGFLEHRRGPRATWGNYPLGASARAHRFTFDYTWDGERLSPKSE